MTFKELRNITKKFVVAEKKYKEFRDKVLGPVWVNNVDRIPLTFVTKEQILGIKRLHKLSDEVEKEMQKARVEFIKSRN